MRSQRGCLLRAEPAPAQDRRRRFGSSCPESLREPTSAGGSPVPSPSALRSMARQRHVASAVVGMRHRRDGARRSAAARRSRALSCPARATMVGFRAGMARQVARRIGRRGAVGARSRAAPSWRSVSEPMAWRAGGDGIYPRLEALDRVRRPEIAATLRRADVFVDCGRNRHSSTCWGISFCARHALALVPCAGRSRPGLQYRRRVFDGASTMLGRALTWRLPAEIGTDRQPGRRNMARSPIALS